MPISTKFHKETTPNKEPLYIIETPNPDFDGTRLKVRFHRGVGRTTIPLKAKMFDEIFGYTVIPHKDSPMWTTAEVKRPEVMEELPPEDSAYVVDTDEEDEIDADEI